MSPGQSASGSTVPLLSVITLGRFAVYRGTELVEDSAWKRRKAKSLFKILCLAPNHQILKDHLLEWLWPDQTTQRATNNLHRTLYILRRILQPDLSNALDSYYFSFKDDLLALNDDTIARIDLEEFYRLIQLGRRQGDDLTHYEAARALYQGDLLSEDLYEDWVRERREQTRVDYSKLLQRMARLYTQNSAYNEAIGCLQDLLGVEPTHEEAYRDLMRLYVQIGQRHQALHLYQQACEVLSQDLDVEPAAETSALYQSILEERSRPVQIPVNFSILPKLPPLLLDSQQRLPLIGREQELSLLESIMERLGGGPGSVVILSGEQGVGKTRLAEEFVLHAFNAGVRVLYGAAHEQEGHLPYGPFLEAIRGALDDQWTGIIREKLGVLTHDLARLLPELAPVGSPTPPEQEMELGQQRQRLFDAIATALKAFTYDSPLLVLLDDLHAAGESSLQFLHYLARQISNVPIIILCTAREEDAQRGTPVARLCRELSSNKLGQRIRLLRLDQENSSRLGSNLLDGGQLAPSFSDKLFQLTQGNPFFIRELILDLKESDRIVMQGEYWDFSSGKSLAVPASVREVIIQRLERLSPEAYRLAGLAAVIGQEFSYQLLQTAAKTVDADLLDLLDEMLNAFLIEETEAGYRFYHGLIRQAVYDEVTTHRRAWLHGQVAQAYESLFAEQLDEEVAILAQHYERAGRYEMAFRYLIRAGDLARATDASREALELYNRALNLYRQHPDLTALDVMVGLRERRAQTYIALSDFDAAIAELEKLLESNREINDSLREGEALYQLGIAHYWAHRLPKATAYLDKAMEIAKEFEHRKLYVKALKLRDILYSTRGNIEEITAPETAATAEDAVSVPAEVHWGRAMLAHLGSDFDSAIDHAVACIDLGQSFANTFLILGGHFVLGMSHASSGHYQLALDSLLHALKLSETAEDRFWRARLLNTIGWVYRELFDFEQAIHFDKASLSAARNGEPLLTEAEGNALANLATDYLLVEDYEQVKAYLTEGLEDSAQEPFMRWRYLTRMIVVKGRLALAEGKPDEALADADEALVIARKTQARKNIARSCHLRGEVMLALGEIGKARAALRHSLATSVSLQCPSLIWPCHLALAKLEETVNDFETAQSHYGEAATILKMIASELTDPVLSQAFLDAPQVKAILARADRLMIVKEE